MNVSRSGVSGSVQTGAGSYNTRRGCSLSLARLLPGCGVVPFMGLLLVLAAALFR